jgi:hypothetical protein
VRGEDWGLGLGSVLNSIWHVSGMHPRFYVKSLKLRITHQAGFLSRMLDDAVRSDDRITFLTSTLLEAKASR